MTDAERAEAVLENIRSREKLARDIQILEQKLRQAGGHIESLGRALSENPANVRLSIRENAFKLSGGVSITLNYDEVRRMVADLTQARNDLFSVNAVLEPRIGS